MELVSDVLRLKDGTPSFVRFCRPRGEIVGRVLLSHGVSEHGGRYEGVMRSLARAGWASAIADHRGHGRSASASLALLHDLQEIADDLADVREALTLRMGSGPIVLWGHSMGGLAAILHLVKEQRHYAAAVLASAATAIPPHVPSLLIKIARRIAKATPALPLLPAGNTAQLTRDNEMAKMAQNDPLRHHGGMRAATGLAILDGILAIASMGPKIRLPVLVTHGSADRVMPVSASREFFTKIGSMDKTLRVYEGWEHELHNELGRAQYIQEVREWMLPYVRVQAVAALDADNETVTTAP